jgi:hypothetical protein
MDGEVILFAKSEELVAWLDENDLLMGLNNKDAEILLNYMEGHGYRLGSKEGKFVRVDICEEGGEVEEYSIDDAIDTVCEWNYELVLEAETRRDNPSNFIDFCNNQHRYNSYKDDERRLKIMFDKTKYGKEVQELAIKLSDEAIRRMEEVKKTKNASFNQSFSESLAITEEQVRTESENVLVDQTDKKVKVR